jgi:hypothetical protein
MYKTGDAIGGVFPVSDPTTSGLIAADSTPVAILQINGVESASVPSVAATDTEGIYSWAVTCPEVGEGDVLQILVLATVSGVQGGGVVWSGVGCTVRPADLQAVVASTSEILQLAKAQRFVDQTVSPWQLVLKDRDTDAELYRWDLLDVDGEPIGSIDTFVAEQVTPP